VRNDLYAHGASCRESGLIISSGGEKVKSLCRQPWPIEDNTEFGNEQIGPDIGPMLAKGLLTGYAKGARMGSLSGGTPMTDGLRVTRKSLLDGARQVEGVAVVIDVYRAFTSAALMVYLGASKLILLADPEQVLRLKREEGCLAVGEVDGKKVPGFDAGNSPHRILAAGRDLFAGRTVAQRTTAGVAGAVAAARTADAVILGSYLTAAATARYLQALSPCPATVTLVAMGSGGQEASPEDETCADYLEHLLTGRPYDHAAALREVVAHEATQKFLRGNRAHYPPPDPIYCLQRDLFDFVLVAVQEGGRLVARRVDVPRD
jgi:2-phosphosulfolactate phosphatase